MKLKKNFNLSMRKFTLLINYSSDILLGLITATLLIAVLLQIISRPLNFSTVWTEELTRYLFIWMVFIGVAVGFRNDESPRISFFISLFPQKVQKYFTITNVILTIIFFILLFITGLNLVSQQLNETSPVLRITVAWIGLCVPLCAVLSIFNVSQFIFSSSLNIKKGEE